MLRQPLHIIGGLVILSALKGAAAVAGGSAALLAHAGYTAAEAVLLALALTTFRAPRHVVRQLHWSCFKACENPVVFSLGLALLIFAGGCTLLWTGYALPFTVTPGIAAPFFYIAALLILCAEVIMWRWILTRLKRQFAPAAAATRLNYRKDRLLLVAALSGALATRFGFPAADMLISAAIAMLILLQALNLAQNNLGSDLDL